MLSFPLTHVQDQANNNKEQKRGLVQNMSKEKIQKFFRKFSRTDACISLGKFPEFLYSISLVHTLGQSLQKDYWPRCGPGNGILFLSLGRS